MKTRLIELLQPFSRRLGPALGLALCLWGNAWAGTTLEVVEPMDFQVIQRTARDRGVIPVVTLVNTDGKTPDVVEVRWVGESGAGVWQPRRLRGGTRAELGLDAPSGGWFRLEVRARDAGAVVASAVVEHVGVGEVLVVAGQSNSANHGEEKLTTQTRLVATFDGKRWGLSKDPQPGASGGDGSFLPALGDQLAVRWKVPIGFVATGVGATSVREWLPADQVFPNPPTLTGNVRAVPAGGWQSTGELYRRLVARMASLGPRGFRAVLWHQGESDANQRDTTRTLPGSLYREQLQTVIQRSRRDVGWDVPWFVALVSYHTPDDTGSEDIRRAQRALWETGIALPGPDSDALVGDLRDGGGKGVHFSGKGLRVHAARWAEKVGPWVDGLQGMGGSTSGSKPKSGGAPGRLVLPGESFEVQGRPAFVFLPPESKRRQPQPWIFYAPTLPPYPDEAERWMHEQFLEAGIAVAGVDVGEAYGNPGSHVVFDALYKELTTNRGFARRAALFGRSRGGLWVSSWAIAHPERVAGIIGIYPVYDFKTYPGLEKAAPAYGLSPAELAQRAGELNPIERISTLAKAGIPIALIHGDADTVVPLGPNSQRVVDQYAAAGAKGLTQLIVLPGQGHSFYEPYFHSTPLVDFAIRQAREGAR